MAMAMASASHLTSFLQLFLLLLLLTLLQLPLLTPAQSFGNLTLGSSLSTDGANTSRISPSGDFAFGFHSLESNATLFLLAIWFQKTNDKTVVWSANRDEPVQSGSKFELTTAGMLSLQDPTGRMVWNSTIGAAGSHASMLDTGNLVLYGSDGSSILWQSFDSPTDTILPSQSLTPGTDIWARLTDDDYSKGSFRLSVQTNGLVLYPVSLPTGNEYDAYWKSDNTTGSNLFFNESGSIDYLLDGGARFQFTSDTLRGSYYRRGTLDPDGVFRQYVLPKTGSGSQEWTGVDFMPTDICSQAIASASSGGSGVCGFNSYCSESGTATKRVQCKCPPQYSFLDPARKYKGCKPDFAWQSCDAVNGSAPENNFDFTVMNNIDWPNMDYQLSTPVDQGQCRNQCLSDCFCGVAIYKDDSSCWKKKFPLSNGRMGPDVDRIAFIKVPKFSTTTTQSPISPSGKTNRGQRYWALIGMSVSPVSVCLNLLLVAVIVGINTKRKNKRMRPTGDEEILPGVGLRRFTYQELEAAANGFNEELGRGSFGRVYKGYLSSDECVAIKKLGNLVESSEKEFMAEIRSIGKTHHKNLTRLVGFCREGKERLLVYEFMPNGSLTGFLFGDVRPDWGHRMQIAVGIARGLSYLHYECSTQIVHCDIKPQNVLLDEYLVARISDFGVAKLLRADQTRTNTAVRGTRGYVAPDWFKNSAVTSKVDVYSYGVMLLEIICCRKSVQLEILNKNEPEETGDDDEEAILSFWAYDCYSQGRVDLLVEGDDVAAADIETVERFATVAVWCIQEEPNLRPNMRQVIHMLEGVVPVPVPPNPFK